MKYPMTKGYRLNDRAKGQLATLKLTEDEVIGYQRQSVPFSEYPGFNRRYETFVFKVQHGTIQDIGIYKERGRRVDPDILVLLQRARAALVEYDVAMKLAAEIDEFLKEAK